MSAAAFRLFAFVALAAGSTALWLGFLHTGGPAVGVAPAIPPVASQSIFAPATTAAPSLEPSALTRTLSPGLAVSGLVTAPACPGCTLHIGSGGLVRARVGSGTASRKAYALLELGGRDTSGSVVARDVISLGRGQVPVGPVRVAQMLDAFHHVIFELVATPDRKLHLVSPAGGLRSTPLTLPIGATVPNDGVSGVAVEVAMQRNKSLSVYVNGVRTLALSGLRGATTVAPRYLATGVIDYNAPASAAPLTALHTQVSVSTGTPPPAAAAQPASAPKPAPAPVAPANTAPPTVNGDGVVGSTLAANPGGWTSASSFAYAWQRCDASGSCSAVDGATGATYAVSAADVGSLVRVRVTATGAGGTATKSSAAVGPVLPLAPTALTSPSLSGDAIVGSTLTADPGSWSDPNATLAYDWRRCGSDGTCTSIPGATGATYTLTADDVGFGVRVRVTATNAGGFTLARSALTAAVTQPVPVPPSATGAPFATGDAIVGSTLTANPGTWSDPSATFAYLWQRCDASGACTAIDGATGSSYTATADDLGSSLRVEVTAMGANGASATADSGLVGPVAQPAPPAAPTSTAAPSVSGDATVGSTLTASPGSWSDSNATISYAWQRCDAAGTCTTIDGATGSSYVLADADLGQTIRVEVTATNVSGHATADSPAVGPVAAPAPTGDTSGTETTPTPDTTPTTTRQTSTTTQTSTTPTSTEGGSDTSP